ncbi:MAG: thioredoxin family protein [Euryarchaeota archaeon]|jgi:thiol-disulfide isomerase/thioredoxin|nr:thioredoxin family protein [Euryarchaeota archaeon]MBT4981657.1 thioredoxin family protein [Euryarchaeota archaeon]MBT5183856.1 thioredoxin family protein [Euryarchaeota archaeon]
MRHILAVLILALCLSSITTAIAEESVEQHWLKRTVLVEERTAIWCPSCAEIDPELSMVARSHGARTAIVGLHIDDAFENNASRARIEYQMQNDETNYGTPTFFVDGVKAAEGYDSWADVQKKILSQESNRQAPEDIALSLVDGEFAIPTPANGQLTLMVLEHGKVVPASADNPGEDTRDRVLIGMKVIDSGSNITIYGDLELPEVWSVILIHEPVEGGEPYGVVEISNQVLQEDADDNLLQILAICIFLGGLLVFIPSNRPPNSEEE